MRSSGTRFEDRASKSGFENAQALWGEAKTKQEKGWLRPPFPITLEGKPFRRTRPQLNIAFRFGVAQSDNLRAARTYAALKLI